MKINLSLLKTTFCGTFSILIIIAGFTGCGKTNRGVKGTPKYIASIKTWHNQRIKNLKKPDGWLNLAGLFWLKEGVNKIGSGQDNDIVFPKDKAPEYIGKVTINDTIVTFHAGNGNGATYNGKPVTSIRLYSDMTGNPTVIATGSLRWFIIKRGNKIGIRLRDLKAPLLQNFSGIRTYPINENWRLTAKFVPYKQPKIVSIPSIIGTVEKDTVEGSLVFRIKGKTYKLDPVEEGKELFIIFADKTSGEETYGAGRFLYASDPDSAGDVVLDFNKAYNPPCAFTPFATCPLPPGQNYLPVKITAGEKKYGKGHHA